MTARDLYPVVRAGVVSSGARDVPRRDFACFNEVTVDQTGRSFPLGASVFADGVNFSVFSRQAGRVELLLFDDVAAPQPARVIDLDARRHRTYHYWHTFVPGIRPGKVLLDPYGRAVVVPDAYSLATSRANVERTVRQP